MTSGGGDIVYFGFLMIFVIFLSIIFVIFCYLLGSGWLTIYIHKFFDLFEPKQKQQQPKPHIEQSTATKRNFLMRVSKAVPINLPSVSPPTFTFHKKKQIQNSSLLGTLRVAPSNETKTRNIKSLFFSKPKEQIPLKKPIHTTGFSASYPSVVPNTSTGYKQPEKPQPQQQKK